MALIFTSWVSQPDPLQWEICYIFLPFTKREKKKPNPNQNTSVVVEDFEQSQMAQVPWFLQRAQNWCCQRLCNRSDASGGLLPYSLLDACSILSLVFPQGMHVAHSLSSAVLPEGSWASVSPLHFLWWLSLWLCMQLRWLFAPEVAVCIWQQGGRGTQLPALTFSCPAFRLFQRIWREVRCPERSDGQGKLSSHDFCPCTEQPG